MINWDKTALLFPGQGSQTLGMGKAAAETYNVAAEVFEQADAILETDFREIVWNDEEALNDTYNTQPALFTTSVALLRALHEHLDKHDLPPANPKFVAGHSLGELTALVGAGAMDFEHGLRLVRERGRLMKEADLTSPGGMAAIIGLETDTLRQICAEITAELGEPVVVANDNCPGQVVISGHDKALEAAMERAQKAGAKRAIRLNVSIAAHSPLMAPSAEDFKKAIDITPITEPDIPIIGNSTAAPLENVADIRGELAAQLTSPVRWTESIEYMISHGVTTFVEVGSKDVLLGLVRRIDRNAERINIEGPADIQSLTQD